MSPNYGTYVVFFSIFKNCFVKAGAKMQTYLRL